jgi:hypothetical protein
MSNTVDPGVVAFMTKVTNAIINPIVGVIFALALVYFMWGLMVFVMGAGDESKRTTGKQHMLWGVIGMVIMVSVYAILQVGLSTFNVVFPF